MVYIYNIDEIIGILRLITKVFGIDLNQILLPFKLSTWIIKLGGNKKGYFNK